jgi:hypothetical protein
MATANITTGTATALNPIISGERDVAIARWLIYLLRLRRSANFDAPLDPRQYLGTLGEVIARLEALCGQQGVGIDPEALVMTLQRHRLDEYLLRPGCLLDNAFRWTLDPGLPWNCVAMALHGWPTAVDAYDLPWELRERLKFITGAYAVVPWATALAPIPGHYVHVSATMPGMVAYTPDAKKGARDLKVRVKPGRYLAKFYPDLSNEQVRSYQAQVENGGLKFATTEAEIVKVYTTGPNSCMSKSADHYWCAPYHPTAAYADGDLAVAYLENDKGAITARGVVWPKKKRYTVLYGDYLRLEARLRALGYSRGNFVGAKLKAIWLAPDSVVLPFIDEHSYFTPGKKHIKIRSRSSNHLGFGTLGIGVVDRARHPSHVSRGHIRCAGCKNWHYYDSLRHARDYGFVCRACQTTLVDAGTLLRDATTGNLCLRSSAVQVRRRGSPTITTTPQSLPLIAFHCDATDQWYHRKDFYAVKLANGQIWEKSYFDQHGYTAGDGKRYANEAAAASAAAERRAA